MHAANAYDNDLLLTIIFGLGEPRYDPRKGYKAKRPRSLQRGKERRSPKSRRRRRRSPNPRVVWQPPRRFQNCRATLR